MPTLVILATNDDSLAEAWERQLLPGRIALRLTDHDSPVAASTPFAAVVVLDAAFEQKLPSSVSQCPKIFVGEPRSLPYEQARMSGRAKIFLSYQESTVRLRELLPLLEEVAEKQSMVEMLREKGVRTDAPSQPQRTPSAEMHELWDFLECAVECIDDKDRLIIEFRRATRHLLRASHAVFFLRGSDGFRADRGTSFFPFDDPLVGCFESQPTIVDGTNWAGPADPVSELAVRNRLALWGARMLVPIHENGRLLGLVALGVRDDGQGYDDADRTRAIFLARLLRHFLGKSAQFARLSVSAEKAAMGVRYLPGTLVLGPDENAPRHVPLVVRDLIGQARRTKDLCRTAPTAGQPFRASAGIIAESGGTWACWQEASDDVRDAELKERESRRNILRELALTLSHELSNSLVSLATFRQSNSDRPIPGSLIEAMKANVAQLEALNDHLTIMQELHEAEPSMIDLRDLAQRVGMALGITVEVGPDPIPVFASEKLLEYALRSLLMAIIEDRIERSTAGLVIKVRSTGTVSQVAALVSLRGKNIELEGVLPEPSVISAPNHGRLSVFLAKEILFVHNGEIHSGPGMECTEVLITIRGVR